MKQVFSILFALVVLLSSYKPRQGVSVTFKNASNEKFLEVNAWIMGEKYDFFNINVGDSTNALLVPQIYSACTIRVTTSKGKLSFLPVDHVGETAITSGKKTISLKIVTDPNGKRRLDVQ